MQYVEVNWSALGIDQAPERSDDGRVKEQLERKVDCQDILSKLPWSVLFNLNEDEAILADLFYFHQKSKSEISSLLEEDEADVEWELNKLQTKIRTRARALVAGTPLEDALFKLGILSAKKIAMKKQRPAAKRAVAKKKAASAGSRKTRLAAK